MTPSRRRAAADAAGFTMIEVLVATLLMTVILAALATVTSQWLPNWNRGMTHVQHAEKLALGLSRMVADLSVAEMIPINGDTKGPMFEGSELAVTFVRTAVGPTAHPGLEFVRFIEKADSQGLALVRERAPFMPMPPGGQIRFADAVVLVRLPYRVTFSYAGADQGWQPDWRGQRQLPEKIRIAVRDGATLQTLALSSVATLHNNGFAGCAGSDDAAACQAAAAKAAAAIPAAAKKDGEP